MPKERKYRYFVEPHDDHTNEVLARHLVPGYECSEQKLWTGRVCQAWEVPNRRFVNLLQKSRKSQKLDFDAYIQENNHPLRPFPWPIVKKKKSLVKRNRRKTSPAPK